MYLERKPTKRSPKQEKAMSNDATSGTIPSAAPPLSWPPPGTEGLQGTLWRGIGLSWTGSLILVLPLLWALAVEQRFYSLGPMEENWEIGTTIAAVGAILTIFAFAQLWIIVRGAAAAAELGYGLLTILEVTADIGRVTGFLIQGKRQFAFFGVQEMAGGAEVLRRYDVEKNPTVSAGVAGAALHNVAFVGVTREQEPFDLAESSVLGSGGQALDGFLPRFLDLVPVSVGPSGSCAPLITSLQS